MDTKNIRMFAIYGYNKPITVAEMEDVVNLLGKRVNYSRVCTKIMHYITTKRENKPIIPHCCEIFPCGIIYEMLDIRSIWYELQGCEGIKDTNGAFLLFFDMDNQDDGIFIDLLYTIYPYAVVRLRLNNASTMIAADGRGIIDDFSFDYNTVVAPICTQCTDSNIKDAAIDCINHGANIKQCVEDGHIKYIIG